MISRRHFLTGTAGLMAGSGLVGRALADALDTHNRMLFGYPPGAVGSKLAAGLLPLLEAHGGPHYALQNLDGRNTRVASETAAHAAADGSTLLQVISASLSLVPAAYRRVNFDPFKDFAPLACVGDYPYALSVGPLVPRTVTNLQQYLEWVEQNPEFRNIGISVYGTVGHLAVRTLAADTGAQLRVQPYQGTTSLMADLRSQSLAAAFLAPGSGAGIGADAPIRSIGVSSRQRLFAWPDQPSLAEQGSANMDFTCWFGWFTQAGVPAQKLYAIREAVASMQASAAYHDVLRGLQLTPANLAPEQISERLHQESVRYKGLLETFKINKFD